MKVDEITQETKQVAVGVVKRGQVFQYFLSLLLLIFLAWALLDIYWNRDNPRIDEIVFGEERAMSSPYLCPGEMHISQFEVYVEGEGNLMRAESIQRVEPAQVVIFNEPLYYPISGPITQTVTVAWRIPQSYFDFETGNVVEFPEGSYLHNISISSMGGRNPIFDMVSLPFTVTKEVKCDG